MIGVLLGVPTGQVEVWRMRHGIEAVRSAVLDALGKERGLRFVPEHETGTVLDMVRKMEQILEAGAAGQQESPKPHKPGR